ncbi:MAG: thiamine phosphate synthase [Desulfuromonadaceae bacterium]|nr:thiamine phosphate synthase [Desulfuromonadaceae bacterium]
MEIDFSLYLITDRHQCGAGFTLLSAVEAALQGGVSAVQLREKDLVPRELLRLARQLRTLTARYGAQLLINDRVDIALAADADGVHLTEQSMDIRSARALLGSKGLIGVSTHSLQRARNAAEDGADFITFSPIYLTPSKAKYGEPQGVENLRAVCAEIKIPVFALGGITPERHAEVLRSGATGIALISAILGAPNPTAAAQQFSL